MALRLTAPYRRTPFFLPSLLTAALLASCGGGTPQAAGESGGESAAKQPPLAKQTWTFLAREGRSFTLADAGTVRYGAGARWVSKTVGGSGQCSNEFFGTDPAPGVGKTCELLDGASQRPVTASGSATLSWTAPQTNADGSALTDLAGFRIYYGTSSGAYPKVVTINNPAATRYTIEPLAAGTYYLIVKAFDTSNNESAASAEVSKTIR